MGLTATRTTRSSPLLMPPSMPPAWLLARRQGVGMVAWAWPGTTAVAGRIPVGLGQDDVVGVRAALGCAAESVADFDAFEGVSC